MATGKDLYIKYSDANYLKDLKMDWTNLGKSHPTLK
jgi:hypothetical protein